MKARIVLLMGVMLLAGCATAPPEMSAVPETRYELPVKTLMVENYAREVRGADSGDAIWSNQYVVLGDQMTVPPFTKLVQQRLATQFISAGTEGELTLALVDARILMKARVADSVPFIGILSAHGERDYKCVVDANFRYGEQSIRQRYEVDDVYPRLWADIDPPEKAAMVNRCLDDVFGQMHTFALELTGT